MICPARRLAHIVKGKHFQYYATCKIYLRQIHLLMREDVTERLWTIKIKGHNYIYTIALWRCYSSAHSCRINVIMPCPPVDTSWPESYSQSCQDLVQYPSSLASVLPSGWSRVHSNKNTVCIWATSPVRHSSI
jgi:hypothetical protein